MLDMQREQFLRTFDVPGRNPIQNLLVLDHALTDVGLAAERDAPIPLRASIDHLEELGTHHVVAQLPDRSVKRFRDLRGSREIAGIEGLLLIGQIAAQVRKFDRTHAQDGATQRQRLERGPDVIQRIDFTVRYAADPDCPGRRPVDPPFGFQALYRLAQRRAADIDYDSYVTDELIASMDIILTDDIGQIEEERRTNQKFLGVPRFDTTVADLVAFGKGKRESDRQRILGLNLGIALEDLAFAVEILRRAEERGLGVRLPIGMRAEKPVTA
jgi:hypothetical protein